MIRIEAMHIPGTDSVNNLTAPGNESVLEQLRCQRVEQRFGSRLTNSVLKGPHRRPIGDRNRACQPTEALVAHAIEQLILHLFVREVVQTLQHQNAHHRLSRIRRSTALQANRA